MADAGREEMHNVHCWCVCVRGRLCTLVWLTSSNPLNECASIKFHFANLVKHGFFFHASFPDSEGRFKDTMEQLMGHKLYVSKWIWFSEVEYNAWQKRNKLVLIFCPHPSCC